MYNGSPLLFSHPADLTDPAPYLGQHTAGLLAELGYDAAQVERLQGQGVL